MQAILRVVDDVKNNRGDEAEEAEGNEKGYFGSYLEECWVHRYYHASNCNQRQHYHEYVSVNYQVATSIAITYERVAGSKYEYCDTPVVKRGQNSAQSLLF